LHAIARAHREQISPARASLNEFAVIRARKSIRAIDPFATFERNGSQSRRAVTIASLMSPTRPAPHVQRTHERRITTQRAHERRTVAVRDRCGIAIASLIGFAMTVGACAGARSNASHASSGPVGGDASAVDVAASDGGGVASAEPSGVRRPPTEEAIQELRRRLPGAIGAESVRELAGATDGELGTMIDERGPELSRYVPADLPIRERWSRAVADERASRTLRMHVSALEEAQRRGGLPHRPLPLLEEAELLPLLALALPDPVLHETDRRVGRYGSTVSAIAPNDFEWTRIRDAAHWSATRLEAIVRDLGERPGPAGQRVRELYAPWLLDAGRADEAARVLTDLETAPAHDAPRWLYLEARALAEAGRQTDSERVLARAGTPGPYEPRSERMARLQVRAASLEHSTRGATDAASLHDRVWALLVLGRTGEALLTTANAPAAILGSDGVREARAVALATDGASGDDLWQATEGSVGDGHDGYVAARIQAGFTRLGAWEFPRRLRSAAWEPPNPALVAELRRLVAVAPMVPHFSSDPLAWHLDLASLPPAPDGLARSPAGRRLLARLDDARDSNDKALAFAAGLMEMVLLAMSGEPDRGATIIRSMHIDPERAQDASDAGDLADALSGLMHPSTDAEARIRAIVSHRVQGERGSNFRAVATAVLYAAVAFEAFEHYPAGDRESVRARLSHEVEVASEALTARIDANTSSIALAPPLYLAAFFLARNDLQALAAVSHTSSRWSTRYVPLLLGIRSAWGNDAARSASELGACATEQTPPAIAARCATWLAREAGAADPRARERFTAEAARLEALARTVDGPFVTSHAGGLADFVPIAVAIPQPTIDLETWRLRARWTAGIGWLFTPSP
jgi:hypothetical protein